MNYRLDLCDACRQANRKPMSISDVTARRLTAVEALDLIGPIGLDEVREKASFSVMWHDRGWGK